MRKNTSNKLSFMIHSLRAISPKEARVLKKVTFGVLNLKIKMTKRSLTVLLLNKLQRRRLGTNDVENFCMNIKRKYAKNKMRSSMMSKSANNK